MSHSPLVISKGTLKKDQLAGLTVLLTGAGGGVGFEAARSLLWLGAYEVFKTAQVELCNTLSGELEGTGVITYSIGPGIVKTETVQKTVPEIAHLLGKSAEEIYDMNKGMLIGVEEAGAGFAASVALATKYNGLEISSIQALMDASIEIQEEKSDSRVVLSDEQKEILEKLCSKIRETFKGQVEGWYNRSIFQKQWILRDFKKYAGGNPEHFIEELEKLEKEIRNNEMTSIKYEELPLGKLRTYYIHQMDLLKGYERDPHKLNENLSIMNGWIHDIDEFEKAERK